MAVTPTYPGVYIEEVPSGVHTITGVATSITAFVGYTARGSVDKAVRIFSFADFERGFGELTSDSVMGHCVRHFFQNGGNDAYVVRVANGALPARTTLRDGVSVVLTAIAAGEGTWGNNLQIDVDYATANPSSTFNLTVSEMVDRNGRLSADRTETFRNLTLNSLDASYAPTVVNDGSKLLRLEPGVITSAAATSKSGLLTAADVAALAAISPAKLAFRLNGLPQLEVTLAAPPGAGGLAAQLTAIAADIRSKVNAAAGGGSVTVAAAGGQITVTTGNTTANASIHFVTASGSDAAVPLKLGVSNGGLEVDGPAGSRPLQTGTVGVSTIVFPLAVLAENIQIDVRRGAAAAILRTITLPIWGPSPLPDPPTSLDELAQQISTAMAAMVAAGPEPYLAGATAQRIGDSIRILPGPQDPNLSFDVTPVTLALAFGAANARNVARYAPGAGLAALGQGATTAGNNGTPPGSSDLVPASAVAKKGLYALEDVDLFNLLVMPDATQGTGMPGALSSAIAYCERRRAFMILDAPEMNNFPAAQTWIGSTASPLRSRNSALYFPRLRMPDPLMNNVVASFPAAGAVAGIYARTDAERGVWKAPAGTSATVSGALGLSYTLTDAENGALNPLGLNCLRTFPLGTVVWGARTGRGADAQADEYKYIPVRRTALFLEETLYRGTQWVVFEPNDEPLWAQIRLNLGAFMHTLYAQGAFQGQTPRDAYFVKCDKETTTQNDIDLGRVNIVVGFAPLKPAEFVIIRIQQIVRDLQV
jgi:phage tail sheath protein FI